MSAERERERERISQWASGAKMEKKREDMKLYRGLFGVGGRRIKAREARGDMEDDEDEEDEQEEKDEGRKRRLGARERQNE